MAMNHSHLLGDPFGFRKALDYSSRKDAVKQRLVGSTTNDLRLAVANFVWVVRRALLTHINPQSEEDAIVLWRLKSLKEVCQYCRKNSREGLLRQIEEVCSVACSLAGNVAKCQLEINKVIDATESVQRLSFRATKQDIYKKLKGITYLDKMPSGVAEVVADVMGL